jgi:hypothetical protein
MRRSGFGLRKVVFLDKGEAACSRRGEDRRQVDNYYEVLSGLSQERIIPSASFL